MPRRDSRERSRGAQPLSPALPQTKMLLSLSLDSSTTTKKTKQNTRLGSLLHRNWFCLLSRTQELCSPRESTWKSTQTSQEQKPNKLKPVFLQTGPMQAVYLRMENWDTRISWHIPGSRDTQPYLKDAVSSCNVKTRISAGWPRYKKQRKSDVD